MTRRKQALKGHHHSAESSGQHRPPYWFYGRVSSDEQKRRMTMDSQRDLKKEWAQEARVKIHAIVVEEDDGISGEFIDERPAFMRVLDACEKGKVGTLIVGFIDRLTRAEGYQDDRARIYRALLAHRTMLVVADSGDVLDPHNDAFDKQINDAFVAAANERRLTRRRTMRGKRIAAMAGRLPQGRPPFGLEFDKKNGSWSIIEEHAEIVRRVFQLALGRSTRKIANLLNGEGIPTPRKGRWGQSYVLSMLRNTAYRGRWTWGEHTIEVPPIVDPAFFDAVQARLTSARRKPVGMAGTIPALLRGLLYCGECGYPMYTRSEQDHRHLRYYCATRSPHYRAKGATMCRNVPHDINSLDRSVWEEMGRFLVDPRLVLGAAAVDVPNDIEAWSADVERCERRLLRLSKDVQDILRLIGLDLITEEDADRRLSEIKRDRQEADAELTRARKALADVQCARRTSDDLDAIARTLSAGLDTLGFEEKRAYVEALVPASKPYGVRINKDGRFEIAAVLATGDPRFERLVESDLTKVTCSSRK